VAVTWTDAEDDKGNVTREFVVKRDGLRDLTGSIWLPEGGGAETLMLFGHGASGDRYQAPIAYLAGRFQKAGIPVLSIDGPVHGQRKVGDGARGAFGEELQRDSHVEDMLADWNEAIGLVLGLAEIKATKLAYMGLSMGSIYGIPLVASRPDMTVATLGLIGMTAILPQGERFLAMAQRIKIPLLFLMQLEDELFPREGCYEVFDAFASKDKRMHCNPGLHPEIPQEEIDFSFEFLLGYIEGKRKPRIVNPLAE
jgi:dienelactone hydrolase